MNKEAEYLYLAVDRTNVPDADALCKGLQKHLEAHLSRSYANRIRSMRWHSRECGENVLIHIEMNACSLITFHGTKKARAFFMEFMRHALSFLRPFAKTPRLILYNDEISCDEALGNPETWTLAELEARRLPAGNAIAISDAP
jgi:hypothetical protein